MIFILFSFSSPSRADLPDTIEKIKPSIVGVGTYEATRTQQLILGGTGFVVADGRHIVTNNHVVSKPLNSGKKERYVVFVGHGQKSQVYQLEIINIDEKHDLALLRFNGPALPALSIANSNKVREGGTYAFTGFPIGAVLGLYPVTHRGIISAITPYATPKSSGRQLSAYQIKQLRDQSFLVYQLDAVAYPGNSGSPLYDIQSGEVVGVINSVLVKKTRESALESPSGISYAIPASYIRYLTRDIY